MFCNTSKEYSVDWFIFLFFTFNIFIFTFNIFISRLTSIFLFFIFTLTVFIVSHCVKSVQMRSFSGPYFPAFGLNTEKYFHILLISKQLKNKVNFLHFSCSRRILSLNYLLFMYAKFRVTKKNFRVISL